MKRTGIYISLIVALAALIWGGKTYFDRAMPLHPQAVKEPAPVFPAYGADLVVPCNIAPLNFCLPDSVKRAWVEVEPGGKIFEIKRRMVFGEKYWKKLLKEAAGGKTGAVTVKIIAKTRNASYAYPAFTWRVNVPIDPYLTYRLVQPTDGVYKELAIWERHTESFAQRKLVSNELMNNNCFNCHTYHNNTAQNMLFHLRVPSEGTIMTVNGKTEKVFVPAEEKTSQLLPDSMRMPVRFVYPAWHPGGEWIAFSTNILGVGGYAAHKRSFNLLDTASNIVLYNPHTKTLKIDPLLWTLSYEETWPAWSADGRWLYFCRSYTDPDTAALYPEWTGRIRHIFFDLCRLEFNAEEGCFTGQVQTLLKGSPGCSYSVPRPDKDGKNVVVCRALFNSVPYHAAGDLGKVNVETDSNFVWQPLDVLNSEESESWHEFSSNGRWMVFASKRMDGHYSLPYLTYYNAEEDTFSTPFILPQKDPYFYKTNLRAFNLPTFVKNASPLNPHKVAEVKRSGGTEITLQLP